MAGGWILDRALHRGEGGLMQDVSRALHGPPHGLAIPDIRFDHLRLRCARGPRAERVLEILPPPGGEIVQDDDPVAAPKERLHDVGADEPGSAGHEVTLPGVPHRPTLV